MKNLKTFLVICSTFLIASCGSDSSSSGGGNVKSNFKSLSSGKVTSALSKGLPFELNDFGAASIGAGGLTSFKMYISSIQFCESIEVQGSAYNNPKNCTTVYENDQDDYNSFDVTAAVSAGAGKYFDLLSATDRAALSTSVKLTKGTYNVGIISWYRPIKMTAMIPLANGNTIYTKTCAGSPCNVTGMDTAPAEESIVDFQNGGTWMKFLKPLVVDGTEDFTVDLSFDLDQRFFGGQNVSNGQVLQATGCSAVGTGYCGIYVPILRLAPVAHKSTESTIVETYEMGGVSDQWKIRVDIYYNSGDPDKAILAADLFPIPTATTDNSVAAGVYVYTVSVTDGVTSFNDVNGDPELSEFTRGDSGTAKMTCPTGASLPGCTAGSKVDVTWSSRSIRTL